MTDEAGTAHSAPAPSAHALDHVIVHVRDALATDARVGELGLDVASADDGLVVRGTITNATRRACIVAVAQEVLHAHGFDLAVHDDTAVASTDAPTSEPEQL